MTPEQKLEVLTLSAEGRNVKDISHKLGLKKADVMSCLTEVTRPGFTISEETFKKPEFLEQMSELRPEVVRVMVQDGLQSGDSKQRVSTAIKLYEVMADFEKRKQGTKIVIQLAKEQHESITRSIIEAHNVIEGEYTELTDGVGREVNQVSEGLGEKEPLLLCQNHNGAQGLGGGTSREDGQALVGAVEKQDDTGSKGAFQIIPSNDLLPHLAADPKPELTNTDSK